MYEYIKGELVEATPQTRLSTVGVSGIIFIFRLIRILK